MLKKKFFVILFSICIVSFLAAGENVEDFQNAMKLYNENKYPEAEGIFKELSERNFKAGSDICLQYAAFSAAKQKKMPEAMTFIEKIKDKNRAVFTKMMILDNPNEIIALSKDEDIEKWPEELIYDALLCRGKAYLTLKNNTAAEKDMLGALKNVITARKKAPVYEMLGNFYRDNIKDNKKAVSAYSDAVKLGSDANFTLAARALVSMAKLLQAEGKTDEALKELNSVNQKKKKYYSLAYSQILFCAGEFYEKEGRKNEALEKYKEILELEKLPEANVENARKKIESLK